MPGHGTADRTLPGFLPQDHVAAPLAGLNKSELLQGLNDPVAG